MSSEKRGFHSGHQSLGQVEEPEFRAWRPRESHLSSEKERRLPPGPNDRFCIPVVVLLRKRPSHWQDNCNERTRHRPCNETNLPEASSCPDRGLPGTLCTGVVLLEAASAPTRHRLFEYSWERSIAGRSAEKQANGRIPDSLGFFIRPSRRYRSVSSSYTYRR